jgi:hypothetical protein
MTKDDFKVGTFFLYSGNPEDEEDGTSLMGLGEVIEITESYNTGGIDVKISWVWSPINPNWTKEDWYPNRHREGWEKFCKPVTEQEKLKLFLKYNFG